MVSKLELQLTDINLTVYGLEEYKRLSGRQPVAVMFALPGFDDEKHFLDTLCCELCMLNSRPNNLRHLIVVSLEHLQCPLRARGPKLLYDNPDTMTQRYLTMSSVSSLLSSLMDKMDYYLFGPYEGRRIQAWGVTGLSFGASIALMAAAFDPRISVAIPLAPTQELRMITQWFFPNSLLKNDVIVAGDPIVNNASPLPNNQLRQNLGRTKICIVVGPTSQHMSKESLFPLINVFREIHRGDEGYDWCVHTSPSTLPLSLRSFSYHSAVEFCDRWMTEPQEFQKLRAML